MNITTVIAFFIFGFMLMRAVVKSKRNKVKAIILFLIGAIFAFVGYATILR